MSTVSRGLGCILLLLLATPTPAIDRKKKQTHEGPTFGSPEPIAEAFRGTVYRLFKGTSWLPDFKSLQPVGFFYTTALDYSWRTYGDEWFAIDYEGTFYVTRPGQYRFLLTSDDGAQLFIDGKRMINNDGIHAVQSEECSIRLEAGMHHLRVPYFQGPEPYIALVLEVKPPGGKMHIFDTGEFRPPRGPMSPDPPETRPTLRRN